MKGPFQLTTVGNMARDANGGYVCAENYDAMVAKHAALEDAYQKQGETAAAMISHRDGIINGLRARIANAPAAIMDTRDVLGICAPTEDDFPALYALQGKRVRLVLDDLTPNAEITGADKRPLE